MGPSAWRIPPMKTDPVSAVEVTGLVRHIPQSATGPRTIAIQSAIVPRPSQVVPAGELVTPAPPDNTAKKANPQETETNRVLDTPSQTDKIAEEDSIPDKETVVIGQTESPLVMVLIDNPREGPLLHGDVDGPMASDSPTQDSPLAMIASDPVRPNAPCGLLSEECAQTTVLQKIPEECAASAMPHGIPA